MNNNSPILDGLPPRSRIAELNALVVEVDSDIQAAEQRVRDIRDQARPLREKLSAVLGRELTTNQGDDAVAALVADPLGAPDVEALTAAVSASRKASELRDLEASVFRRAIAEFDRQADDAETHVVELQGVRQQRWEAFAVEARKYLLGVFYTRFVSLRDEVMEPLRALGELKNGDGKLLQGSLSPRLSDDSSVSLVWYRERSVSVPYNVPMPVGEPPAERQRHALDDRFERAVRNAEEPKIAMREEARHDRQEDRLYPLRSDKAEGALTIVQRFRATLPAPSQG